MNLVVDIGNTRDKYAVFLNEKIIEDGVFSLLEDELLLTELFTKYEINHSIVSSVKNNEKDVVAVLKKHSDTLVLSNLLNFPFENLYKTKNSLGVDRLALVAGAAIGFQNMNTLIIDAGTCITYDYINNENQYFGGGISPGIEMRYKSLHNFTGKLPLLNKVDSISLIGQSTEESIHSGVINGVVNEINGVIEAYERDNTQLTIVLTGGDTYFLSKRLKNGIFADPKFLMRGLNNILNYNSKND